MKRQIENLPYEIYDNGAIININTGRVKKITYNKDGYGVVGLYDKTTNRVNTYYLHHLMAEAFLPKPYEDLDYMVCFKDNNRGNWQLENLYYTVRSDKVAEDHKKGLYDEASMPVMLTKNDRCLEFKSLSKAAEYFCPGKTNWSYFHKALKKNGMYKGWKIILKNN